MGAYSSYRFVQRLFLALLLVLAVGQVSGCASVDPDLGRVHLPDAGQLDAPTGGRFVEQTDPRWWRLFGDAILTRIVEDALTANAEVRLALARVKEARADAGYTRADLLPQIGARAQASRDRSSASAPGAFGESSTSTYYQVGFDSSWEVDLFGGRRMAARAAGETVYGMHIFLWSQWAFRIPATWIMVVWLDMSVTWVFSLLLFEEFVKFVPFHLRLFKGKWKHAKPLA